MALLNENTKLSTQKLAKLKFQPLKLFIIFTPQKDSDNQSTYQTTLLSLITCKPRTGDTKDLKQNNKN